MFGIRARRRYRGCFGVRTHRRYTGCCGASVIGHKGDIGDVWGWDQRRYRGYLGSRLIGDIGDVLGSGSKEI